MMMKKWKAPLLFVLALLPIAVIGSILVTFYELESFEPGTVEQMLAQAGGYGSLLVIACVQGCFYAVICGFFGCLLSEKIGLMRPFGFSAHALKRVIPITVLCGILFAGDYFVFGRLLPEVAAYYAGGISLINFAASLLYGGIMEEVMMRLFLMSLLAFIFWKLFARKKNVKEIPVWIFIAANILAALLFAAGHLPATVSMFGTLSPMILFRCFLLNGALGLVFGYFYRKYGIQYAMIGHLGCHLVSKVILLLVIS